MSIKKLVRLTLACTLLMATGIGHAQNSSPVRLLVGFAAGGTSDGVARVLAHKLPDYLKRPVIVENKAGALGVLAIRELINAPADRPAFFVGPFSTVVFPRLTSASVTYDIFKELQSVASLTSFPLGVVVSSSTGVKTPTELVAWMKGDPKRAQFGTAGAGGHNHFLSLELGRATGISSTVIPYRGNSQVLTDLIPGHIPAGVMVAGEVVPHTKDGRVRIVGVLSPERSPLMPDVPTFKEHGIAIDSGEAWYGVWTSAKASKADVDAMQDALRKVLETTEVRDAIAAQFAMKADFRNAPDTAQRLRKAHDYWAPIIQKSGFKAE